VAGCAAVHTGKNVNVLALASDGKEIASEPRACHVDRESTCIPPGGLRRRPLADRMWVFRQPPILQVK